MWELPTQLTSSSSDATHQPPACKPKDTTSRLHPEISATFHPPFQRDRVLAWLSQNVPAKRLQHILGVEAMAIQLAQHHGLDVDRAAQAGLMHDLAKCFKPQRLMQLASAAGIEIDPVFAAVPHLLHADVGAIVAQTEFGIQDEAILAAIRNHTLGSPGMSLLSCVVFLADTLEPGRGDTPELESLRAASFEDLHKAVWLTCDYTLKYLLDSKTLIHPRAVMTRNWAMQQATQRSQSSIAHTVFS